MLLGRCHKTAAKSDPFLRRVCLSVRVKHRDYYRKDFCGISGGGGGGFKIFRRTPMFVQIDRIRQFT